MRPFWGRYLNWPGVVGDDPRPGDQNENLTVAHANRLNELKAGKGNPERFHTLKWYQYGYQASQSQQLPDNVYGHALTISNNHVGYRVAESVYLRMKTQFPQRFAALREEILLLGPIAGQGLLTAMERQQIAQLITRLGGTGDQVDNLLAVLGINTAHEFSLHKLATEPADANEDWNAGSGGLHGLLYALVLNDLAQSDANVRNILASTPKGNGVEGIWECPNLGQTVWDVLQYKLTQAWKIRGAALQDVHRVFFPIDNTRVLQPIFYHSANPLYQYLRTKISTSVT
jgi:hypothetical protein